MKKLKVLQVITSTVGGAGKHVFYLAHALNQEKFETAVAYTPGQHLDYLFLDHHIPVLPLTMGRTINLARLLADGVTLYRYIKHHHIDIVHTHNTLAGIIGRLAAWCAGVPVILHTIHTFATHPYVSPYKKPFYLFLERSLDKFTTHYTAGSHAITRQAVEKKITTLPEITTIHYAVNPDHFLLLDTCPATLWQRRKTLGIGANDQVIGFIGRLETQKGPHIFIEAVAQVIPSNPQVKVLLVGDGPLRSQLARLCQQLQIEKNVFFLGWRKDIPEILSMVDIVSLASLWEAFGMVFAEAGLMQKPVVATCVEGIPEVVVHGKSGLLVPPHDPGKLAEALITLLQNPEMAKRMGVYAQKHVLSHFTLAAMIHAHEQLYHQLWNQETAVSPSWLV